ncbi:MAG: lipid-A-disaccharide synthase [Calditrichaeota bacterium]|nr:lipid-A-disaccharide synthase [Calditrichota bacterium]
MPRILIIAGETSGDVHGSGVVREIRRRRPDVDIVGIGGPRMAAAGMTCFYSTDQMAILGFTEVVRHFPFIRKVHARLTRELETAPPDLLILIDYPGFNLRFAKQAKKRGIPILYYISPQVWAWGKGRVAKIARLVDKMAVIFDFEEKLYREAGVDVTFVGHPLLDSLRFDWNREQFLQSLGYPPETRIFGLLPGSRPQEVRKLLPEMIRTFVKLKELFPDLQGVVSRSPQLDSDFYAPFLSAGLVLTPQTHALMQSSHFMIVACGFGYGHA